MDHYLTNASISLFVITPAGKKDKTLRKKVEEAIAHMVANGAVKKDYDAVARGTNSKNDPLYIDLLHAYVHNRFVTPAERDLVVAWDNAQPFFQRIWQ